MHGRDAGARRHFIDITDLLVCQSNRQNCGEEGARAVAGGLNQLQPLHARMAVLADDDVIVHGDAERTGDVDDRLGHLDIRLRRRRIAGGMVVQETTISSNTLISLNH
jgi:hypothetical protein